VAAAGNAYDNPASSGASPSRRIHPDFCGGSDGGNWYQFNYDTVVNNNNQTQGHVDWEQWYAVAVGGGCTHFMQQTKYHIVDGNNMWFQWGSAVAGSGASEFACVGDCHNTRAATAFGPGLTYNYNNASTTNTQSVGVKTNYCTAVNIFGACDVVFPHGADFLVH
jgi:hypothetical protein